MEDSKLLKFADWLSVILIISTIICVILTLVMPFIDNSIKFGKVNLWVAAFTVLSAVGLMTLRFFINNDHDLKQPKQKKSEEVNDDEDVEETVETEASAPIPLPAKQTVNTGDGSPTPSIRQQLSNRMMINVMDNTRQRLMLEIKYQKNTSYFNLAVSIVLSILALGVMWIYAFDTKTGVSDSQTSPADTLTWLDFAYVAIPKF